MYGVVQIVGSLSILVPFVGVLLGRMTSGSHAYLAANAVGSSLLTGTAVVGGEWGFLLLEAVWAAVSCYSLARKVAGRPGLPTH